LVIQTLNLGMSKDYLNIENIASIRGATTATGNTFKEIENSVIELINELILRNSLDPKSILSITFTVTNDLDACFPASIARKCFGLESVAFLDCQQMYVPNDIDFCIRLMAQVKLPANSPVKHPYLREAAKLRADRC
tara:strand:+ start:315 stop:725 length:411 start_codon:yes stop_codon:yes gene_type:complete